MYACVCMCIHVNVCVGMYVYGCVCMCVTVCLFVDESVHIVILCLYASYMYMGICLYDYW